MGININRYIPGPEDIIIGGNGGPFLCQIPDADRPWQYWSVYGTILLTNRVDTGSGWRYTVRYGWYSHPMLRIIADRSYFTLFLRVGGVETTYNATDNYAILEFETFDSYWMFDKTTSIVLPYGQSINGTLSVYGHGMLMTNFNYTGPYSSSGGGSPSVTPPSPKPSPPSGLYFNNPTSITSTSAYVDMGFTADSSQDSYYHMAFYDNAGFYRANPARTGRGGNLTYYRNTIGGLSPETTYSWVCREFDKDNNLITSTANRTFRTLSQDVAFIKVGGVQRRGLAFIKNSNVWKKGAKIFIKDLSVWKNSADQ